MQERRPSFNRSYLHKALIPQVEYESLISEENEVETICQVSHNTVAGVYGSDFSASIRVRN